MEGGLDAPMVCGACVFHVKGHGGVAEGAKRGDEGCLDFISFLHLDLVIARVSIQEGDCFAAYD